MTKIRKAEKGDVPDIDKIYVECSIDELKLQFPKNWKRHLKDFERLEKSRKSGFRRNIQNKNHLYIVVEDKSRIVGFGAAHIKNRKGFLDFLYVKKEYRKQGVGIKIAKRLLSWLKSRKIREVTSHTYVRNIPSVKLHERMGFDKISYGLVKKLR